MYRYAPSSSPTLTLLFLLVAAAANTAQAQPAPPVPTPARGQLLYNTHCIECHNTQMHWRVNSQVRDWQELLAQVTRWQANAGLGWSGDDVGEVARHLNETIYRLPLPEQKASR